MAMMTLLHRKKKQTKKMAGIAAGAAAAGAASALLLTPKNGKEMRGHVAKGARSLGSKAAKKMTPKSEGQDNTYDASERAVDTARQGDSGSGERGSDRNDSRSGGNQS